MSDDSNQTSPDMEQPQPNRQIGEPPTTQPVRSRPVHTASQPVNVRRYENRRRQENSHHHQEKERRNLGEYIKFGVTAIILLGTPVVIALLIPFIFGQLVPTILGSNLPPETPVVPGNQIVVPSSVETPALVSPTDPQMGIGGEVTPIETPTLQGPNTNDVNDVLVHLVRTGDSLESIAQQYGLTSADIAAANNLQNPDEIFVGAVLIIPQTATAYP